MKHVDTQFIRSIRKLIKTKEDAIYIRDMYKLPPKELKEILNIKSDDKFTERIKNLSSRNLEKIMSGHLRQPITKINVNKMFAVLAEFKKRIRERNGKDKKITKLKIKRGNELLRKIQEKRNTVTDPLSSLSIK